MIHRIGSGVIAVLAVGMALMCLGNAAWAQEQIGLLAAAGKIDITPDHPVYMAGYGSDRLSADAHDPITARCLVLEYHGNRIALVACDVIGLPRYQIEAIRALTKSVQSDHNFIAATHTHSGPDTLGQWGRDIQTSGVDKEWMASVRTRVAAMIDQASAHLQPADLKFASTMNAPKVSKNIRVPQILDTELGVMQAVNRATGTAIATVVNFACHPEILNNHHLSADFPHWLDTTVEAGGGGVSIYFNGAQGGMITAAYDETTAPKGENWAAAESIGTALGKASLAIIAGADRQSETPIFCSRSVFTVPLENQRFKMLIALHVFPQDYVNHGAITTEVNRITIGPAEILTLPGEVLPNIGFYLKDLMTGQPKFLLGLCGDELGYILTPEDYGLKLYGYETSVSVGREMEPLMVQNLRMLMSPIKPQRAQSNVK